MLATNSKGSAKALLSWSLFPSGNKGITPIISVILLLMMTVAIAGASFFWIYRVQNQMQGGTESYQSTLMTQMASAINVVGVDCKTNSSSYSPCLNITILFQNTGNTKVPVSMSSEYPTTAWILKDENQATRCASNWNSSDTLCIVGCGVNDSINVGETHMVVLNLTGNCSFPCGTGGHCPDKGKAFSFTVDFSGKTTASSTFIVPGG